MRLKMICVLPALVYLASMSIAHANPIPTLLQTHRASPRVMLRDGSPSTNGGIETVQVVATTGMEDQRVQTLFELDGLAEVESAAWQAQGQTERRFGTRSIPVISLADSDDADHMMRRSLGDRTDPVSANEMLLASSDIYSEEQKSAAVRVELARHRLSAIGDRCVSRDGGDVRRFVWHLTEIENLDVTLPADKVLATISTEQYQKLQGTIRNDTPYPAPDAVDCEEFDAELRRDHLVYYAIIEPAAAKILRAIYASDETMRIVKRDADLAAGCIKQAYNAGARAFAATRSQCECHTRAIKHNASDAQIDAWLAALDTKPWPDWMAKALTEAQQCSEEVK